MTKKFPFSEATIKKMGNEYCAIFNKAGEKNDPFQTVIILNEKNLASHIQNLRKEGFDTSAQEAALVKLQKAKSLDFFP